MSEFIEVRAKLNKHNLENSFNEIIDERFNTLLNELGQLKEEVYRLYEELKTIKIKLKEIM